MQRHEGRRIYNGQPGGIGQLESQENQDGTGQRQHLGMDHVDLYIYHIWDHKTPAEEILEGMNDAVQSGKTRYIGIANAYAYQVAKMNALAEKNGWAKFISVQNHYNLIIREEERERFPFCREENIAMTPYSALASGKLAKRPGETSKRQAEDSFMHFKYDATAEQDNRIVERVVELADRYGVEMTQISLAWLLTKVESPIVGATRLHHIEGAVRALDVRRLSARHSCLFVSVRVQLCLK